MQRKRFITKSKLSSMMAITAFAVLITLLISLPIANAASGVVKVTVSQNSSAKVRASASLTSKVIGKAKAGQTFNYSAIVGDFFQISYNGVTAYLHNTVAKSISSSPSTPSRGSSAQVGTVKVNSTLNVRSGAGTQYSIVGSLKNGVQVEVLGQSGSWYQIRYGSINGYVSSQYLVVSGSSNTTPTTPSTPSTPSTPATPSTPDPEPVPNPVPQQGLLSGKVIFIDPGHGGSDPGAVSAKVNEKDVNLAVANKAVALLKQTGAEVIPTRTTDTTVNIYSRPAMVNKYILEKEKATAEKELANLEASLSNVAAAKQSLENQKSALQSELSHLNDQAYKVNVAISSWNNLQDVKNANSDQATIDAAQKRYNDALAALDSQYVPKQSDADPRTTLTTNRDAIRAKAADVSDKIAQLNKSISELDNALSAISSKKSYIADLNRYISCFTNVLNNNKGKSGYPSKADLIKIFEIEKKYQNDVIFVSIHCNSTTSAEGKARGEQAYYMAENTNSSYYNGYNTEARYKLAELMLQEIPKVNGLSLNLKYPSAENFAVLREANVVSCLVELGFLNNAQDRALLTNATVQQNTAIGIYNAIVKYFTN